MSKNYDPRTFTQRTQDDQRAERTLAEYRAGGAPMSAGEGAIHIEISRAAAQGITLTRSEAMSRVHARAMKSITADPLPKVRDVGRENEVRLEAEAEHLVRASGGTISIERARQEVWKRMYKEAMDAPLPEAPASRTSSPTKARAPVTGEELRAHFRRAAAGDAAEVASAPPNPASDRDADFERRVDEAMAAAAKRGRPFADRTHAMREVHADLVRAVARD